MDRTPEEIREDIGWTEHRMLDAGEGVIETLELRLEELWDEFDWVTNR